MATCGGTEVPLEYQGLAEFFGQGPPLSQAVGYVVVLLFGLAFSFLVTGFVWLDTRYNGTKISSEEFNTAGRTIKTGLIAANIVAQWTWAATLLQSSNVAYKYGVSGPFWYASGATIQVLLFGIIAIQIKKRAPCAHTFLEMVRARWGKATHMVFIGFALVTNTIVTSMLLLGGAASVHALTGTDINLTSFLIPWGVIAYTATGGLKASFLSAYIHTGIIHVVLIIFMFYIYAGPSKYIGSADAMYNMLTKVAELKDCSYGPSCEHTLAACGNVKNNHEGSYLTMLSKGGLIFGVINIIGNFGTVFVDQAYWQSAIAAKPDSSCKGYLIGGLAWFCVPFTLATCMGLAAVALQLPLTTDEANAGLVPPAVAVYMLGKGGAILILIMLFMAVTATGSAEMIAVSSIISYDVYRPYINPNATGQDILRVSRYFVVGFGCIMGLFSIVLNEIGLSLGWVYLFMGVIIGSAVPPVAMLLTWSKCTAPAAVSGALFGMVFAIIAWIAQCKREYGTINVTNLGQDYPMLAGNLAAILVSALICVVVSLIKPDNYTWDTTKDISMLENDDAWRNSDYDEDKLEASKKWIVRWGSAFTVIMVVIWPLASLPVGVFDKGYFGFWVAISLIWGVVASVYIWLAPLIESWGAIVHICNGIMGRVPKYVAEEGDLKDKVVTVDGIYPNTKSAAPSATVVGEETKA